MKPDKRRVSGGGRGEAGERGRGKESERGRERKRQSRAGCVFSSENQMLERVEWQGMASFLNKIIDNFILTKEEESMAKRTK